MQGEKHDEPQLTYFLVDGENIDWTLSEIIKTKPGPESRPRWDRIREFVEGAWPAQECRALFFRNESAGHPPLPFIAALRAAGYRPVLLEGPADVKVVDVGILRTLEVLRERPGHVVLASHDRDFAEHVRALVGPERRVAVLGFREFLSAELRALEADGVKLFDLEYDAKAFNTKLPRLRIVPIDAFDPTEFLG